MAYLPVNLANVVVSFGMIVVLTRLLSPEEFGRYAIAMITLPNPASIKLHAGQGFQLTGNLVDVGRKFDQTLSVCLMQRSKAR